MTKVSKLNKIFYIIYLICFCLVALESRVSAVTISANPEVRDGLVKAQQLLDQGNYNEVLNILNELIISYPEEISLYKERATLKAILKYPKESVIADWTVPIELEPNVALHYYNRGSVYGDIYNMYTLALNDVNQAIAIGPVTSMFYHNQGMALYSLGNKKAALESFNQALALEPEREQSLFMKANCLWWEMRDYEQALHVLSKVIEINPNNANAFFQRAKWKYTYYNVGMMDPSERMFSKPYESMNADLNMAGKLYKQQGNKEMAKTLFQYKSGEVAEQAVNEVISNYIKYNY